MTNPQARNDPTTDTKIPLSVLLPGLAGLIPFVALSLSEVMALGLPPVISLLAFNTYGAVILSFVGAIWWGLAAATQKKAPKCIMFYWSVIPALIGWFATLVAPDVGVLMLSAGFVLQWLGDAWLVRAYPGVAPAWLFSLRTILTAGVLATMAIAWWFLV
ncbi:MAG: DUF3429 domain-containing protein [Burkholderiaceae bacterium]|nr:DUF3429 domain-containing protein [Burkholderiaceae bacterium]MCD8518179.1 DUF3429 domain-containing protein [Burkholderiaceae bacterium]MCD8536028.1 DUF3429 domain-containing protein [Burkholderiaceae bacterium]MCD8564132.1 DUF3429 domain-containing protein [Burkholderiaceae bacterium]